MSFNRNEYANYSSPHDFPSSDTFKELAEDWYYTSVPPAVEYTPSGGDLPDIQEISMNQGASELLVTPTEISKKDLHSWYDPTLAPDPDLLVIYNIPTMKHHGRPALITSSPEPAMSYEQHVVHGPKHRKVRDSIGSRAMRTCVRAVTIRPKHPVKESV
jgi:hypothetical protein